MHWSCAQLPYVDSLIRKATRSGVHPFDPEGVQFPIQFGAISYPLYSAVFCSVFCCVLKIFGNTLYSAVFRKCRIWANMPFCILSVFLNNERIHQNTLGIHAQYVFLNVIENTSKYGYEIRIL